MHSQPDAKHPAAATRSFCFGAIALTLGAGSLTAQGVDSERVLLGQSCALKGPASALGQGMKSGLEAAFAEINKNGGVHGRRIDLDSINDSYEPKRCTVATNLLVNKREVFAMVGGTGTPTARVAVPIVEKAKVPFIAPFTGAGFLRQSPVTVNLRASYFQEMEALAHHLIDEHGMKRIACFYQNDAYGKVGLAGITKALKDRSLELVATGTYKRNTAAVGKGLKEICPHKPDAVVMVGAYKACAQFIIQAKKLPDFADTTFCNISFVGTAALLKALGGNTDNCIVSQVVPFPWDTKLSIVKQYHAAMKANGHGDDIGFVTLEGYLAGRTFIEILERAGAAPTRASFLEAARAASTIELDGLVLEFGEGDNQGLDQVWLVRLDGDHAVPLATPQPSAQPGK